MRIAAELMLEHSIELQRSGLHWTHPWDHYPFMATGKCVWLRYADLDAYQARQVRDTVTDIQSRLLFQPRTAVTRDHRV